MENKGKVDYLIVIMFFLASFRKASPEAISYSVPAAIGMIQQLALPITLLIILYKCVTSFNGVFIKNRLILFYLFFYFLVYLSEIAVDGLAVEPISKIITVYVIAVFFSNVLLHPTKGLSMESMLISLYYGIIAYASFNLLIYLLGIGSVVWKGRLFGVSSHPNFIGLISSIGALLSTFYLINFRKKWKFVLFLIIAIAVMVLSGSRNALLSYLVFCTAYFVFYTKNYFGKAVLIFGGICMILFFFINFSIQDLDFEGRGNNREGTWSEMISEISNLGILGKGKSGATSNGFLFVLTSAGFFGGFFFYLSFLGLLREKFLRENSPYNILFKSALIWIIISSMFEGYFLDTVSVQIFFLMFLLTYYSFKNNDSSNSTSYSVL